ncbi:MAG: ABC-type uncharacterized transport system substrate-binding protein [Desulforhopalus sp.]|jgi:ABC-type uncharacterized transport system substrate-binding protein
MTLVFQSFFITVAFLFSLTSVFAKTLPTCVYISSYHQGYEWSDGIELSLREVLDGHCSFIQFDMDTKRHGGQSFILQKAKEAKELILKSRADVVITSDDNAAKFVIKEYFKDSSISFVFCGVNWTAKEYGFPYENVTGMIEVTPVGEIFELAVSISKGKRGVFIGDDAITDRKDFAHFVKYAEKNNIELERALVQTVDEWKEQYLKAQGTKDFIILGHNSAIKGWEDGEVKTFQAKKSTTLVLTTYRWMVPFAMIGLVIKPEEQGEWAGEAALGILQGFPIKNISIIANRSWSSWMNLTLLGFAGIVLPENFIEKSQQLVED